MARTFPLVRPVLLRVSKGNQMVPNAPKQYETHQNFRLGSNWVDRMRLLPKCTQTVRNAAKRQFSVQREDRVRSLRQIPTRLRGTNFCTSSACFAPSFVRQPNGPECTQTVQNAPKYQIRVQWGGCGAFVAKNSDATSWHELLH